MEFNFQSLDPAIGAGMATRSDIPFFRRDFVPCLLPAFPLSWILRWFSVLSTQPIQSVESPRDYWRPGSWLRAMASKFLVESNAILQ